MNIIMMSDSYKCSHYKQYPPKTEKVYSYFESREGAKYDSTMFFGLQYFLMKYMTGEVVTQEKIDYAEGRINAHMGEGTFNRAGWEYILKEHDGCLPVKIRAVDEGSLVPTGNVLMTVENTDPACYWLTNYLETLLVQTWYPSTVATQSYEMRKVLQRYLDTTGSDEVDFKLHDFGFRGVTCPEQAGLGGMAHLVSFKGTDNMEALEYAKDYYHEDMAGFSIPASEHSTITAWGRENETAAMRNMLEQYPTGLVACVSDSYNIWEACRNKWGGELKDQVLSRDGVLVVRPDSGEPSNSVLRTLFELGKAFGTFKRKGYRVLDPKVRVIQGDGIDASMMSKILAKMEANGWSADNITFGSGGGLLQKLNRDTQRFAFKCSSVIVDGERRDVFKDPITDGGKISKKGKLKLVWDNERYRTVSSNDPDYSSSANELRLVYLDGTMKRVHNFADVRERAKDLVLV